MNTFNPEDNLGLLDLVASRYAEAFGGGGKLGGYQELFEEFRQAGAFGLIKACETYKEDCGLAFSTVAAYHIRSKITSYIDKMFRHKRDLSKLCYLEDPVSFSDEENEKLKMLDTVEDASLKNPCEQAKENEFVSFIREKIATLDGNELYVIKAFYGIDCERQTYEEIGKTLGFSRQRAQQLHSKAIKKLRCRIGTVAKEEFGVLS